MALLFLEGCVLFHVSYDTGFPTILKETSSRGTHAQVQKIKLLAVLRLELRLARPQRDVIPLDHTTYYKLVTCCLIDGEFFRKMALKT